MPQLPSSRLPKSPAIEKAQLTLLFIQIVVGGLLGGGPFLYSKTTGGESSYGLLMYPARTLITIVIIMISLALRSRPPVNFRFALLALYMGFLLASTAWSPNPPVTFRAALDLSLVFVSIALLCNSVTATQAVGTLATASAYALILSCFLALAMPHIGTQDLFNSFSEDQIGSWRGVFVEKNGLGATAAVGLALMLTQWNAWRLPILLKGVAVASGLACLVFARSANGVVGVTAMMIILTLFFGRPSRYRVVFAWLVVASLAVITALTSVVALALELLGRDATFTGRTGIWTTAAATWQTAFLLGHSFAAGTTEILQPVLLSKFGIAARHAHNGYLEILVETGVVGLVLFLAPVLLALWCASNRQREDVRSEQQSTNTLLVVLVGALVMAGGDVTVTRLSGGCGIIVWTVLIAMCCLPTLSGQRRGRSPMATVLQRDAARDRRSLGGA